MIDVALPNRDGGAILTASLLFAVVLLAQFACGFGEAMLTNLLGQSVMRDLRMQIFAHLQRLSVAFFDRNPALDVPPSQGTVLIAYGDTPLVTGWTG